MTHETEKYTGLTRVLNEALAQATTGKGKERHVNDKPFDNQPIMEIARMLPGVGSHAYQVMKKAQEAANMLERGQHDHAIAEFRGVIIYAAAAILIVEEIKQNAIVEGLKFDFENYTVDVADDPTGGAK